MSSEKTESKVPADTQEKLKEILLQNLAEGKTPAGDIVLALIIHAGMTEADAWKLVHVQLSEIRKINDITGSDQGLFFPSTD